MDAGDPHVVEAHDLIAQHLRRDGGLLGHGDVAGAAGGHHDAALARGLGQFPDHACFGQRIKAQGQESCDMLRGLRGEAGDEHGFLPVFKHGLRDAEDVLPRLARAVDHLRHALADAAVQIHLGVVAELLDGLHLESQHRVPRTQRPVRDLAQQRSQFRFIHGQTSPAPRAAYLPLF